MSLVVSALGVRRPGERRAALEGVSFEVSRGHVLLVIGPSGAGKSTLLRAVAGLEPHAVGTVAIDGKAHVPGDARALGFVFQSHELFPHLTALENCTLALRLARGETAEAAERTARAWLLDLGVESFALSAPASLSHGQRQRVALARALVLEPRVLLLDEPTSSLDALARRELATVLGRLKARGVTIVAVAHDFGLLGVSDRVAVVSEGRIVDEGVTADLVRNSTHPVTRALVEASSLPAFA